MDIDLDTDILLIAGLWLDGSAWEPVASHLHALGRRATPVRLPGQGVPPDHASLEDQLSAVLASVDAATGRVFVVGHSAACTLAWMAADARPDKVARVAMVGGFPSADGETYAGFFPVQDGFQPFPGWEPFDGADSADLTPEQRQSFADAAIPVPEGVANGVVHLGNDRRYEVPVDLVCPEFSPAQAREWIAGGEVPELARVRHLRYVDIDSGHWPMISCPTKLADLLAGLTDD